MNPGDHFSLHLVRYLAREKYTTVSASITGISIAMSGERLKNQETQFAMEMEREAMRRLNLGCSMPAGMICTRSGTVWTLTIRLYSLNTREYRDFASTVRSRQDVDEFTSGIRSRIPPEFGYSRGGVA